MPRQRSAGRAPSRPTVPARAAPAPQKQQTRPAATMAAPPQAAPHAPAAPPAQSPGLFGQMASTAAGVAVGSSIGHGIANMFGGGSSEPAAPAAPDASAQSMNQQQMGNNCAGATKNFTQCMDDHNGNMSICNWYLDQLKACQSAASQY